MSNSPASEQPQRKPLRYYKTQKDRKAIRTTHMVIGDEPQTLCDRKLTDQWYIRTDGEDGIKARICAACVKAFVQRRDEVAI
jgi:hypothetical protein